MQFNDVVNQAILEREQYQTKSMGIELEASIFSGRVWLFYKPWNGLNYEKPVQTVVYYVDSTDRMRREISYSA